ncbi:MAG: tetratricopeptide repeat protein [Candidatus Omnitrophota bacterium]
MKLSLRLILVSCIALLSGCSAPEKPRPPQISSPEHPKTPVENVKETPVAPVEPAALEKSVLSPDDRKKVFTQFLQGALLEKKYRYEEAGDAYAKAYKTYPESAYLGAMTGGALLKSGKIDEAIQYANKAIRSGSEEAEAHRVLGEAYKHRQKWNDAVSEYEKMLALDPSSLEAMQELSQLYQRSERYDDEIGILRRMIRTDPAQEIVYRFTIAVLYYRLNRLDDALAEYGELARLAPRFPDVYLRIGGIYELQGRTEKAIEAYGSALNSSPDNKEEVLIRKRLGKLYLVRGAYPEAIEQYSSIRRLAPDDLDARKNLAFLYIQQGKYEESLEEVEAAAKDSPADYRIQGWRKEVLESLGRKEEACQGFLNALERALEEDVKANTLPFLREASSGDFLQETEDCRLLPRLEEILKKAITKQIAIPRALFAHANLAAYRKNLEELQQDIELIFEGLNRAEAGGKKEEAEDIAFELLLWPQVRQAYLQPIGLNDPIELLEKCRRSFPGHEAFLRILGIAYMERKNWLAAEERLKEASGLMEKNTSAYKEVLFQLAGLYEKMNRLADVELAMKEAISRFPEDPEPYNYLGYTFADRNVRLDEALRLIETALKYDPDDGNIVDSLGWVYFRLGNNQTAIKHLQRASELRANHPVILDHLGDAYKQEGDNGKALEFWKKALECGPQYPIEFTAEFQNAVKRKIEEMENSIKP